MEPVRSASVPRPAAEASEFVRFCYRRRRTGWPELYDEMCAVAGRGLFRGWGPDELAQVGIGLSLFELPALAALSARVIAAEAGDARAEPHGQGTPRPDAPGAELPPSHPDPDLAILPAAGASQAPGEPASDSVQPAPVVRGTLEPGGRAPEKERESAGGLLRPGALPAIA